MFGGVNWAQNCKKIVVVAAAVKTSIACLLLFITNSINLWLYVIHSQKFIAALLSNVKYAKNNRTELVRIQMRVGYWIK